MTLVVMVCCPPGEDNGEHLLKLGTKRAREADGLNLRKVGSSLAAPAHP